MASHLWADFLWFLRLRWTTYLCVCKGLVYLSYSVGFAGFTITQVSVCKCLLRVWALRIYSSYSAGTVLCTHSECRVGTLTVCAVAFGASLAHTAVGPGAAVCPPWFLGAQRKKISFYHTMLYEPLLNFALFWVS